MKKFRYRKLYQLTQFEWMKDKLIVLRSYKVTSSDVLCVSCLAAPALYFMWMWGFDHLYCMQTHQVMWGCNQHVFDFKFSLRQDQGGFRWPGRVKLSYLEFNDWKWKWFRIKCNLLLLLLFEQHPNFSSAGSVKDHLVSYLNFQHTKY